jgi:hypothetical protein
MVGPANRPTAATRLSCFRPRRLPDLCRPSITRSTAHVHPSEIGAYISSIGVLLKTLAAFLLPRLCHKPDGGGRVVFPATGIPADAGERRRRRPRNRTTSSPFSASSSPSSFPSLSEIQRHGDRSSMVLPSPDHSPACASARG